MLDDIASSALQFSSTICFLQLTFYRNFTIEMSDKHASNNLPLKREDGAELQNIPKTPVKGKKPCGALDLSSARARPYPRPGTLSPPTSPVRAMTIYPRRNPQAAPESLSEPAEASAEHAWKCPHCEYVQKERRRPDLARHIATHGPNTAEWACCGVPRALARRYGLDPAREDAYTIGGVEMMGGCGKAFSRRDALQRHLRVRHAHGPECVGDVKGDWHPRNKEGKGKDREA